MEYGHAFPLGHGSDKQVRETNCPDMPSAPQCGLHVQGAAPVLIMGGQPLISGTPVDAKDLLVVLA